MNDKGHYHSYEMYADPSKDPPASRSSATPLYVEHSHTTRLPALLAPDPAAERCVMEFFTAHIRNPHTRKAYARTSARSAAWAERHGIAHLRGVEPVHVAAYVEELQRRTAAPSVKLHLTGIRMLFDWLVVGQVLPVTPLARSTRRNTPSRKAKRPSSRDLPCF